MNSIQIRTKLLPFIVSIVIPMLLFTLHQTYAASVDIHQGQQIQSLHPPAGTPTPLDGYRLPFDRRKKSVITNGPGEGGPYPTPGHYGKSSEAIDFSPREWTDVYASKAGTVYINRNYSDWGNLVIIAHDDGFYTYYAHLNTLGIVGEKTPVVQGQKIGVVGKSGTQYTHLHFEARDQMTPTPSSNSAAYGGDSTNHSLRRIRGIGWFPWYPTLTPIQVIQFVLSRRTFPTTV